VVIRESSLEHIEGKNQLVQSTHNRGRRYELHLQLWMPAEFEEVAEVGSGAFIPITDADMAGLPATNRIRYNAVD